MKTRHRFTVLIMFAALFIAPLHAQLVVNSSVTAQPGTFHYEYSVSNQTPVDFSIVTLGGFLPAADTVQNLFAPSGFLAVFDSGLGLLSFLEDTQPFLAGDTSGIFSFDSPYAPGAGFFEAIDITGGFATGVTIAPALAAAAVPEPATTAALAAALLVGLVLRRKFLSARS